MSHYHQSTESIVAYKIKTAQPISIKEWFTDNADLIDITVDNNPLHYYEGMLAQDVETGQTYRWIEATDGEIAGGYTYGTYEHDGIVYTGRTFNFVPIGARVVAVNLATGVWPPVEELPVGTIAIREFVDTDTYVGIFIKTTTGVGAGVWTEVMRTAYAAASSTAIEAIVVGMFAGSGGDFGSANTIARSDHIHDALYMPLSTEGLLFKANLRSADNLDDYRTYGIYNIRDGSDLPVNFPTVSETGYGSYTANDVFVIEVYTTNGSGAMPIETIQIVKGPEGPLCTRVYGSTFPGTGWTSWARYEATQTETLAGTEVNKFISPYGLQNHQAWQNPSYNGAYTAGTQQIQYRKLSNGLIQVRGYCTAASVENYIFDLPAPAVEVNVVIGIGTGKTPTSCIVNTGGQFRLEGSATTNGVFVDFIYSLD